MQWLWLEAGGKRQVVVRQPLASAVVRFLCVCVCYALCRNKRNAMAPIASNSSSSSTWSSLTDYESHSGSSGISSSLMVLPIIHQQKQQQQQQQRFRIQHHPAMMKSYGSVSSFEDPYVSLLGPAKPPRALAVSGPFRNYSKFTLASSHNQHQQQQQRWISKSDWDLVRRI